MNKELNSFNNTKLTNDLQSNIAFFKKIFSKDDILRVREIHIENGGFDCALFFMDGMINATILNDSIIRPLLTLNVKNRFDDLSEYIQKQILFANEVKQADLVRDMISALLYGDTVLLTENTNKALLINTKGWRTRGISEPNDERVLQGPREGFDEALMFNVSMLRRKLPTPDLCVEFITSGRKTDTKIFICYLDSLVKPKLVETVKKRIKNIDIDGILDSNYINELINRNRFSLFKTVGSTERPDIVAARLLEGRVAVFVDGTPVVLTMPYFFNENFQSDDDYYLNFWFSCIGRILRYACYFLSICVPALYVALTVFHPNLLPAPFMITISSSRAGIPFPTFVECLLLIFVFEVLKETGIRMQQSVGHALSIVGGLVVGQAAVEAKIVSAPMLIIVALSGIAGLMLPRLKTAIFYSKVFLTICVSLLGMFGFFIGWTLLHIHLYSLESFGVDYMETVSRFTKGSLKDTVMRAPWWKMITRPKGLTHNIIRFRKKEQ